MSEIVEKADPAAPPLVTGSALKQALPAALSVMPVAMLFGVLAARSGWSVLDVLLLGLLGFTGSGQFAALPLSESGTGFFTLLLVAASINCRYLPMAISTIRRMPRSAFARACSAHMLGDEAYACERDDEPIDRMLQIRSAIFLTWVLAGAFGAVIGGVLPEDWLSKDFNLGFPASAVLFYLALSQLKARRAHIRRHQVAGAVLICLCAAASLGLILTLGPVYFWIPGVLLVALLLNGVRT
ncbi:AzlC family ABC transporter permease [Stutzerimonas kunmingensis]|uniref:AzlC family ABC transporter permease n=1 Tax=Stutzerimonas kunmingensis TaxID=1211807 RepID=UPI00241D679F|nr:AzlC family ABC transporter permease [Stutzerimonas kunmingensis]